MASPAVVLQTLRYLSLRQIRHQLRNRWAPAGNPPALPMAWTPPRPAAGKGKNTRRIFFDGKDSFRFNNEERRFEGLWNEPGVRKLWLYNLHYMGWLFDLEQGDPEAGDLGKGGSGGRVGPREEWIRRWIRENPREGKGNGWEPYPLSLRLFNWCKHYSLAGKRPDADILESIGSQAAWLLDRLEFHLDGNHLLENLLSLCFVGFFLDGKDARCRKALGKIQEHLDAALSSQFLADGGHYELSPMYHAILLERMLDLLDSWPQGADPFPGLKPKLETAARRALAWLDVMSVAGRFSLFNDAAYDSAPDSDMLLDFGGRLLGYRSATPEPLRSLEASGYFRAESGPFTMIFDGGRLGPDHQMGHAQGDMLSFCLWHSGAPILVHPGNYEYLQGPMRDYCRSTASHNTLTVDDREQADWWASHRVGWRGRPRDVSARYDAGAGKIVLAGAHDGFSRLPGAPLHHRHIELGPDSIEVIDTLKPSSKEICKVYFHFHPHCTLRLEKDKIRLSSPAGPMTLESNRPLHVEEGWHCPEFGLRIGNPVAVAEFREGECRSRLFLES